MSAVGTISERLTSAIRVNPDSGCWEWQRHLNRSGYGAIKIDGACRLAHRVAYQEYVGPIPTGLEIDHLCRNLLCCNPAHLEPVTQAENKRRAGSAITHCKHGHPYAAENTYIHPERGTRHCRACQKRRLALWRAARVEGAL